MVHVDPTGKATFRFRHAANGPVFLVGDFCHWHTDHLPMRKVSDSEWTLMMRLPPGTFEFRYLADGTWYTDYAAFGVNRNRFGDFNSVVRIPKVRPAIAEPEHIHLPQATRLAASA
jgi:hypothetical protein